MGARATAYLTCDGCGQEVEVELADSGAAHEPTTIDEAIDGEGWFKRGILLDRLLCEDCAEEEADD